MTTQEPIRFESLNLIDPLLQALHREGYTEPTPIQLQAIPHVLEERDLLGCAQTGTGKTAAFALPILQLLSARPARVNDKSSVRALILTPTRELAAQIAESFNRYGHHLGLKCAVIFGGVGQGSQVSELRRGVDILIATPGRLLDLMEQKLLTMNGIEIFVLDEADRMLDMGFINDVKRVLRVLPKQRQSLFFSATMPPDIQRLADTILTRPVKVEVTPIATTAEKIEQSVYFVEGQEAKRGLLAHLITEKNVNRALVFTRTKHGADKVAKFLNAKGITAAAIHGNKSQNNRVKALDEFKQGVTRVLVATDIAARGIDIDGVSHVINYEIPNVPETYVHRIGRTARAGAEGLSYSFCDNEERDFLRDIERLIRQKIAVVADHPFAPGTFVPTAGWREEPRAPRPQQGRGGGGRGGQRGGARSDSSRPNGNRPSGARSDSAPRAARGDSRYGGVRDRHEGRDPRREGTSLLAAAPGSRLEAQRASENAPRAAATSQQVRSETRSPQSDGRGGQRSGNRTNQRGGGSGGGQRGGNRTGGGNSGSNSGRSSGRGRDERKPAAKAASGDARTAPARAAKAEDTTKKKSWWKRLTGSKS